MIKELVNFTKNLDEDFKKMAIKPSKGLHIIVNVDESDSVSISEFKYYNGTDEIDDFLSRVLLYERYSSYIDMNKQQKFDPKQKIHSSSPFSFAFNFSLGDKKKEIEAKLKNELDDKNDKQALDIASKKYKLIEIDKSIEVYFQNSKRLCLDDIQEKINSKIDLFQLFCSQSIFPFLIDLKIEEKEIFNELKEKDYVRVYLGNISDEMWISSFEYYFNNVYPPNELQESDFITTYSDKKPFLTHKTATFDIGSKISGADSKVLKEFKELLSTKDPKVIPNPLPIFIFKKELQHKTIGIFKENGFKLSFKELVEKLVTDFKDDFGNYYLLNWSLGKDIRINDLDFVSNFEYEFKASILNLFELKEKDAKQVNSPIQVSNVFELEKKVFYSLIQNKYNSIDYFGELKDVKGYEALSNSFLSLTKYRKPIYDFVYKSKRQGITNSVFYELVFNRIKDDIKHNRSYSIKEKLNIWFSLYENFNHNHTNEKTMASKLNDYQEFVDKVVAETADFSNVTDEQFMFIAGQVIDYLLLKSKSADNSYQLLEPYTQKSNCKELQKAIANDFARYKHANYSGNFEKAASFVLTYETDKNLKNYLPELLAGIFAKNQLFAIKKESITV